MNAVGVLLVRHGESDQHVGDITGGWTDTNLTARGHDQAERVAERLARELDGVQTSLYTSDLARAADTARPIAARLGVNLVRETGLRELGNGQAAGLTKQAARSLELPRTEPPWDWVQYPGGESWGQMYERVALCLDTLCARSEGTAVVVSHWGAGCALIQAWLRMSRESREQSSFSLDAASLTDLRLNEWGERSIVRLNDTSHLLG